MWDVETFTVMGSQTIHCESCEQRIGNALKRIPGVRQVNASHQTQKVRVEYSGRETTPGAIRSRLENLGYAVEAEGSS